MDTLESKIKNFLSYGNCKSCRYGYGYGGGFGSGGEDYGFGDDSDGSGYAYGWGRGDGWGCGSGEASDNGPGTVSDEGSGYAMDNSGLKEVNGDHIYMVDDLQTIIKSVHGNIAQGFILQSDLTLKPCYIVKGQNKFAHGDTLHDAFTALQEKLYDDSTEEERIEAFRKKFPDYKSILEQNRLRLNL